MIIKARGTVNVPIRPRSLGMMLHWSKSVNKAIQQLRDRAWDVPMGGSTKIAGSSEYVPWRPTFSSDGETYKARFNLGTLNEVPASNWNDEFTLTSDEDVFQWVVLTVTTGSGKVTGMAISIATDAPSEDTIAEETPPVSFKIVLGAIGRSSAKMIRDTNLEALASEVFRDSKSSPATGSEIFTRWWRWSVTST